MDSRSTPSILKSITGWFAAFTNSIGVSFWFSVMASLWNSVVIPLALEESSVTSALGAEFILLESNLEFKSSISLSTDLPSEGMNPVEFHI